MGTAFTGLWLVVWTSAILVVLYFLLASVVAGDWRSAAVLLLWLAAAGLALWWVGRRFAERLSGERIGPEPGRRGRRRHVWKDGLGGAQDRGRG